MQKSGDAVRVNVQLIKAASDSHLWADTFDRKLTDIFSVESEVAKTIADSCRRNSLVEEEQVIAAKPTDNPEAYDAYLRGLAYSQKTANTTANTLNAQKYLKEAVRLDPKFALAWALLSYVEAAATHSDASTDGCAAGRGTAGSRNRPYSTAQSGRSRIGQRVLSLCLPKGLRHGSELLRSSRGRCCLIAAGFRNCSPMSRGGKASGTGASRTSTKPSGSTRAMFPCLPSTRFPTRTGASSRKRCGSLSRSLISRQTTSIRS